MSDSFEHGNEPPGSIKGGIFLDQVSGHHILKKGSAPAILLFLPLALQPFSALASDFSVS
jgi:hypothetical protein